MNCKTFGKRSLVTVLFLVVCCIGCGSSSTVSDDGDDFTVATVAEQQSREGALKLLFTEDVYNTITAESRNNLNCRETNREELGLSDLPNGEWYYTYDNLIAGMAKLEEFASDGADENTNKLEIAAFLANIAQETGGKIPGDPYGSPGCVVFPTPVRLPVMVEGARTSFHGIPTTARLARRWASGWNMLPIPIFLRRTTRSVLLDRYGSGGMRWKVHHSLRIFHTSHQPTTLLSASGRRRSLISLVEGHGLVLASSPT